jgi:hypothetical protein
VEWKWRKCFLDFFRFFYFIGGVWKAGAVSPSKPPKSLLGVF